jgi:hypothetical protein
MGEKLLPCPTCGVDVMAIRTAPVYYLLRRTVGVVTKIHEYDDVYNGWVTEQFLASLYPSEETAKSRRGKIGPCEIIPVKLLEAPHES